MLHFLMDGFVLTVTRQEVENLLSIFREEAIAKDKLDRTKFRDILHNTFRMTDDILMDRGKHRVISSLK